MTDIERQGSTAQDELRGEYEPPRIERLGTVEELTMGFPAPGADSTATFGSAISDRRLKTGVVPVDSGWVLEALGAHWSPADGQRG